MYDKPLKGYTVCFIFNSAGTKILMQLKDRTLYKGKLNGVGGKIEEGELPLDGAYREIEEETSLTREDVPDLKWIATIIACEQCDDRYKDYYPELNFFAGTTENLSKAHNPETESEVLVICDIKNGDIDIPEKDIAGDGNLHYIIPLALRSLKFNTKEVTEGVN